MGYKTYRGEEKLGITVLNHNNIIIINISKYSNINKLLVNRDYTFGGIGCYNKALIAFMNNFFINYNIKLDPIYNAKLFFAVIDLIKKDFFYKKN